jgi:DNA-binding NarL/FixJ family response regulator
MSSQQSVIRLLLVDDHEIVRVGLRSVLARCAQIKILAEAGTVAEAVQKAVHLRPDVVLMDVRLPDGSGVEACREIRSSCPDVRVLFLTSFADDAAVLAAVFGGADGYLVKEIVGDALSGVIQTIARGQSYLDPTVTGKVLEKMRSMSNTTEEQDGLSAQERRVLALLADGKTNKEIASELELSSKTVKNYLGNIFAKLQVKRRAQAVAMYTRLTPS